MAGTTNLLTLRYDLDRNLIVIGEEAASLQRLSLINIVVNGFKKIFIIKKILRENLINRNFTTARERWINIENVATERILTPEIQPIFHKEFRQIINLISNEIFEFLWKLPNQNMNIFFLRNFVFTWQATINRIETVHQILEDENDDNDCKLEIALMCFAGKEQITKCLKNIGCNDINMWAENKHFNVAMKISIYFWSWLINDNQKSRGILEKLVTCNAYEYHRLNIDMKNIIRRSSSDSSSDNENYLEESIITDRESVSETALEEKENLCNCECSDTDNQEIQKEFSQNEKNILYKTFYWMLKFNNEIAVNYFWDNFLFIRKRLNYHISDLLYRGIDYKYMNIVMFIFSKCAKPSEHLKKYSFYVLQATLENLRWKTQFLKYYELLQINLNVTHYLSLLYIIVQKIGNDLDMKRTSTFNKYILKRYLSKMLPVRKEYIRYSQIEGLYRILDILFCRCDTEGCKILLFGIENNDISKLLMTDDGIGLFREAFLLCDFNFMDSIIKELQSEENKLKLKKEIFEKYEYLASDFVLKGKHESLKSLINWSSNLI